MEDIRLHRSLKTCQRKVPHLVHIQMSPKASAVVDQQTRKKRLRPSHFKKVARTMVQYQESVDFCHVVPSFPLVAAATEIDVSFSMIKVSFPSRSMSSIW